MQSDPVKLCLQQLQTLKAQPSSDDLYQQYYLLMTQIRDVLKDDLHPTMAKFYYYYGIYLYDQVMFKEDLFGQQIPKKMKKKKKISLQPSLTHQDQFCTILDETKPSQPQTEPLQATEEVQGVQDDQQLAFENLQCARTVFKKLIQANPEDKLARNYLFSCYTKIGDLLANQNKFLEAIEEYNQAIVSANLSSQEMLWDRAVAEAHFMIGKVNLFMAEPGRQSQALNHFIPAANIILRHLAKSAGTEFPEITVEFGQLKDRSLFLQQADDTQQVKSLKSIIYDLLNQIQDAIDQRNHTKELQALKNKQKKQARELQEQAQQLSKPISLQNKPTSLGSFGNARRKQPLAERGPTQPQVRVEEDGHVLKQCKF